MSTEIPAEVVVKAAKASSLHFEQCDAGERWQDCDTCRRAYDRAHYAVAAAFPEFEQLRAERDALRAELAEAKRDHAMTAEYVGKQLGFHQPIPCATSVGCAMALGEELAEARAAIERVRARHTPHDCHRDHVKISTPIPCLNADRCRCGRQWPCNELRDIDAALDASQRPEDTREETGRG